MRVTIASIGTLIIQILGAITALLAIIYQLKKL
jgi:hypothetical protein